MKEFVRQSFALALAAFAAGAVFAAQPRFYSQAKGQGVGIMGHAIPKTFGVGAYETKFSVINLKDSALRGEVRVVVGGKVVAKAPIDLPPKQLSSSVQELVAKGSLPKESEGADVKVVIAVGTVETVCYAGKVGRRTEYEKPDRLDLPRFKAKPGEVKFVKSVPLAEGQSAREFVENGGVLVVAPIKSADDLAFTQAFVDKKDVPTFKEQKGQENPYDTSIAVGEFPLLDWPYAWSMTLPVGDNRLRGGNHKWLNVQRSYTMAVRRGSGALIVSVLPLEETDWFRGNLAAHCALEAAGVRLTAVAHDYRHFESWKNRSQLPTVAGGKTTLSLANVNTTTTNINIAFQMTVRDANGVTRQALARRFFKKIGENFKLAVGMNEIALEGPCHVSYELFDWDSGVRFPIAERDVTLPDYLEVVPPHYRGGIVSTCRKTAAIRSGLRINRHVPDLAGEKWRLAAFDATGREVASAEGTFAAADTREVFAWLPFAKDAPAGAYALVATVGGRTAKGELKIVPPEKGQIIVDQDGFLLHEGRPHLPLGIYHCHSFDLTNAVDETGLRALDMGFDWMQIWEWDYYGHISGNRELVTDTLMRDHLFKAEVKDLSDAEREKRIDRELEENRKRRELLKKAGMYLCFEGFNIWGTCFLEHPGPGQKFAFEKNPEIPRRARLISEDPDQLVRMYYLADEAGGNFNDPLARADKLLHAADPHLHPTFNLGNLEAVLAGDFGGLDCYRRYYGGLGSVLDFTDKLDEQRRQLAPYEMRPFSVPQAFGNSPAQSTETPEYVRIQAYLSLIHGASGIGFYCWKQTGDWKGKQRQGMSWNPPTAHAVKKLISEIRVFEQALMTPGAKNFFSEDGNVHAILCGNGETGRYLVCGNAWELPVETSFAIPAVKGRELEPCFGAPRVAVGAKGEFSVKLSGWGTAVWRLK